MSEDEAVLKANKLIMRGSKRLIREFKKDMAKLEAKYKPMGLNLVTRGRQANVIKKLERM